jgi:hypothetical protein
MPADIPRVTGYQLLRRVGAGSFGDTYLALDSAGQRYAIKVSGRDVTNRKTVENELRATELVAHPNLATSKAAVSLDDDRVAIIRDWIDGETLESAIGREDMCFADVLDVAQATLQAIQALHIAGVAHLDVKPANILVPHFNNHPDYTAVRLVDFGFAKIIAEAVQQKHTTTSGPIVGTPFFMAPERLTASRVDEVTPCADVYSFGIVLFQLVYRRLPFEGDSVADILFQILRAPLVLPAVPGVPAELVDVIRSCTAKDPKQRPAVHEVLRSLREVRHAIAVRGALATAVAPLQKPLRRKLQVPLVLFASGVAVSGGVMVGGALLLGRAGSQMGWAGILLLLGGLCGVAVSIWLRRQRRVADATTNILFGLRDKRDLTRSLYIQIEQVIARCEGYDEQFLGTGVALLLQEYHDASASGDRQAALINAMQVFEKLLERLSPWYVRHEKILSLVVGACSVLPGLVTFIYGVVNK